MRDGEGREEKKDMNLTASHEALESFAESVSSLWCPSSIAILEHLPSPLEFHARFVSKSLPCILRLNDDDDVLLPRWNADDIESICGKELALTVNVTPDGHGDTIRAVQTTRDDGKILIETMFVLPEERQMNLGDFIEGLRNDDGRYCRDKGSTDSTTTHLAVLKLQEDNNTEEEEEETTTNNNTNTNNGVYYYSLQNDCLRSELSPLVPRMTHSFERLLSWAEAVFGTGPPDAINLWMGPSSAVSSLHKDHYENLFYVASGEKIFHLYPPADAPFLPVKNFKTCRLRQQQRNDQSSWIVVREEDDQDNDDELKSKMPTTTPWIHINNDDHHNLSAYRHCITVRVKEGDVLYLPSLWFHRVTQTCETVAINWWFDMHFDSPLFCYFELLQNCQIRQGKL